MYTKYLFLIADIDKISSCSGSPVNLNNQITNLKIGGSTIRPIPADQLKCNILKEKISSNDKKLSLKTDISKATFVSVVSRVTLYTFTVGAFKHKWVAFEGRGVTILSDSHCFLIFKTALPKKVYYI